jgi:O-acetylhomoserine/O-acetylserine sulfhydrylase-like pyridoxal-dependent enzyme
MKRHCENALAVAKFLEKHKNVVWVKVTASETWIIMRVIVDRFMK